MRTAFTVAASLLATAFVALFQPNEYAWMKDEIASGQLPEDADMMFKFGSVIIMQVLVQAVAIWILLRSGRKTVAAVLALVSIVASLLLFQRL